MAKSTKGETQGMKAKGEGAGGAGIDAVGGSLVRTQEEGMSISFPSNHSATAKYTLRPTLADLQGIHWLVPTVTVNSTVPRPSQVRGSKFEPCAHVDVSLFSLSLP